MKTQITFSRDKVKNKLTLDKYEELLKEKWNSYQKGKSIQNNFTPLGITLRMLGKINIENKSILVIANSETFLFLKTMKNEGKVNYKSLSLLTDIKSLDGKEGVHVTDFSKDIEMNFPSKFDIIIANPPYGDKTNTQLHMDFLDKCVDISNGDILFVHPGTHFLSPRDLIAKRKISPKIIKSIELFNGNKIFNINKYFYLSITHIDVKKKDDLFDYIYVETGESGRTNSVDSITHLGSSKKVLDLRKKYTRITNGFNLNRSLKCNKKDKFSLDFIVPISGMRGNTNEEGQIYKDDFFTVFPRNSEVKKASEIKTPYHWFEFDNEKEAKNFLEFLKTDFFRMGYAFYKFNNATNGCFKLIPELDFKRAWTDSDLYEKFNFTKDEIKTISELIPKYY